MSNGQDSNTNEEYQEYKYDFFNELFATLSEAPEKDHAKILKSFLLSSINTMREHSVFQLDLLEKIALIALNNVQDVRLYSLEARIKELEEGKPITFGEIVGELVFVIAVEATILVGITSAPVLASTGVLLMTSLRTSARAARATRRTKLVKKLRGIERIRSELVVQELRLLNHLHSRRFKGKSGQKRRARQRDRKITLDELQKVRNQMDYLNQKREFDIEVLSSARSVEEAAEVIDDTKVTDKLAKGLRGLLGTYAHHVDAGKSVSRSFSATAQSKYSEVFVSLGQSQSEGDEEESELYQAFTTTHSVMQVITQCESLKLDIILHYSQMYAILAAVDEDEIFDSFETVLTMEEIEYNLFDLIDLSEDMLANLEDFVVPMELAIWLLYLESNNILEREESASSRTVNEGYSQTSTRFIGNDFVEEILSSIGGKLSDITDSPRTNYIGRRYPGLHILDEHQSYYLFHKFAKKSFSQFADKVPVSKIEGLSDFIHKDVENDTFDNVLSMQKVYFWSGENEERSNLVKEMGIVVIEYFNYIHERISNRTTFGFSDTIPEGTKISDLFNNIQRPTLTEPFPEQPAPSKTLNEFLKEQEELHLAEWESRIFGTFEGLIREYNESLDSYLMNKAILENIRIGIETFDEEQFTKLFMIPAETRLKAKRSAIEGYIGRLENDEQGRTSDKVEQQIDELKQILQDCPVEKTMFSTFPR
ncbi:MAG: hypothetical protein F6K42_13970 [Leptolyngbya sp. SIO1D8]|nr:hypothetical protein [Leptolyngbya sp. SIO1D8]